MSLSAGAAGALVFSGAAVAQAKIVPELSIANVKIDDSPKQVRNKKGSPDAKEKIQTESPAGTTTIFYYGNDGKKLKVSFFQKAAYSISTRSPKQKTDTGLHVGSSKQDLLNDYPGVVREAHGLYRLGDMNPGEVVTTFRIKQKQITEIAIARFLD